MSEKKIVDNEKVISYVICEDIDCFEFFNSTLKNAGYNLDKLDTLYFLKKLLDGDFFLLVKVFNFPYYFLKEVKKEIEKIDETNNIISR